MKYYQSQAGFSLVETLVAITILLIVIIGPMSIATSASRSTSFASEQVVAFFLAQEGAEIAQKARDDILLRHFLIPSAANYLADTWGTFANQTTSPYASCFSSDGCGLELNSNSIGSVKTPTSCSGTTLCALYYDASANADGDRAHYTYVATGNTKTLYTRVINFEVVSDHEIRVISKVYWRTGSLRKTQEVVVETFLFDVYGN